MELYELFREKDASCPKGKIQKTYKFEEKSTMGLFGKSKKEREKEYMSKINVTACLNQDFEMTIDDIYTIVGVGTVATGTVSGGMCREGEVAKVNTSGNILEATITVIDVHTKERKPNGCAYKTEHVGLGLRGIAKEQLKKGDTVIIQNANKYGKVD